MKHVKVREGAFGEQDEKIRRANIRCRSDDILQSMFALILSCLNENADYFACSRARVTVVISQTSVGP